MYADRKAGSVKSALAFKVIGIASRLGPPPLGNVTDRYWPKADMSLCTAHVRFWG
jgi:hypothetical protein